MRTLNIPAKRLRAEAIAAYVRNAGLPGVVCFTCGHAAEELRRTGLEVVEVGPTGALRPGCWWAAEKIARTWPHLLDATSGHLPVPIMASVAEAFRKHLGDLDPKELYRVPTGSGESIVCLAWAYPDCRFVAVYDDKQAATTYDPEAPLNGLVRAVAEKLVHESGGTRKR